MDVVSVVERSDDRRSSTTNVSGDKVTLNPLWSEKLRFSSGFPVASPTGDVLRISTHILKDDVGVLQNMLILGVEPSQRTYKDRMLTDTSYELIENETKGVRKYLMREVLQP